MTFSTHAAGNYNKLNLAVHVRGGKTVKLPILAEAVGLLRTPARSVPLYIKILRGESHDNLGEQLWGFKNGRKGGGSDVGRKSQIWYEYLHTQTPSF